MFHLAAFTELLGTVANTDINALADQIIPIQNDHFLPPRDYNVVAAYVASATLSRARLNSPKIRQTNPLYVRPINVGTLPATDANILMLFDNPYLLRGEEEIALEATSAIAMGTERFTGLIWLMDRHDPAPSGDVHNVRITSTTAAVANVWSDLTATFESQLPAGRYAIVGCEHQSTNGLAIRIIVDDQYLRPGWLSITALANRLPYEFYRRLFGTWGHFRTTSLPRFQVLANAADAVHEVYLSVVRVGP